MLIYCEFGLGYSVKIRYTKACPASWFQGRNSYKVS